MFVKPVWSLSHYNVDLWYMDGNMKVRLGYSVAYLYLNCNQQSYAMNKKSYLFVDLQQSLFSMSRSKKRKSPSLN